MISHKYSPEESLASTLRGWITLPLAAELQAAYSRRIRQGRRTLYYEGDEGVGFWRDLAIRLQPIGDDGADYIEFQFRQGPNPRSLEELSSQSALAAYDKELKSKHPLIRATEAVERQLGAIATLKEGGQSLQSILFEEETQFNPLIAYCMAVEVGDPKLIRQFAADAARFLKRYPEYRPALGARFREPPGDSPKNSSDKPASP